MRLAVFKGERSVDDLAARLFQIRGRDPQASKQASDALLRANPQLANLDRLPAGSVVVVPDTPHPVNTGETVEPAILAATGRIRAASEQVAAFTSSLAAVSKDATTQADATLKLLKDRSLKAAADKDPTLAQRLASIDQNTKATLKDLHAKQTMLQQAIAQMRQDLENFLKPSAPPPQSPPQAPGGLPPPTRPAQPSPTAPAKPAPRTSRRRGRRKTKKG